MDKNWQETTKMYMNRTKRFSIFLTKKGLDLNSRRQGVSVHRCSKNLRKLSGLYNTLTGKKTIRKLSNFCCWTMFTLFNAKTFSYFRANGNNRSQRRTDPRASRQRCRVQMSDQRHATETCICILVMIVLF